MKTILQSGLFAIMLFLLAGFTGKKTALKNPPVCITVTYTNSTTHGMTVAGVWAIDDDEYPSATNIAGGQSGDLFLSNSSYLEIGLEVPPNNPAGRMLLVRNEDVYAYFDFPANSFIPGWFFAPLPVSCGDHWYVTWLD